MRSSADWIKDRHGKWVRAQTSQTRGLNPNRQPLLKEEFKGAAHLIATQMTSHPLHQAYQRLIDGGMKPNLAQLTIATPVISKSCAPRSDATAISQQ